MLSIENVSIRYDQPERSTLAVKNVTLSMAAQDSLGLVGESGCGKSTLAHCILRLLPPQGKIVGGKILWNGKDLAHASSEEIRLIRGNEIAMIFQDPFTSLNPVLSIEDQLTETVTLRHGIQGKPAREKAVEALQLVKIGDAEHRIKNYPHQWSGGMLQRAMIAMALIGRPKLLIADEPTTALDVTVQKEILDLLNELRKQFQMGLLLITHNLALVQNTCAQVAVMRDGEIMEKGAVDQVLKSPAHPYTQKLLGAVPR